MWTLILAILSLGVLIVVHEAGHYFVARWSGMRVERFSLGFGPGILKWRHKGTQFQIAPIPFGGFVQIVGMNPHEEYDEKDPSVYPNRPAILRFLTIFAGPFTNILFASLLIFIVFVFAGSDMRTGRVQIDAVPADGASAGKLVPADVILTLGGEPILSDPDADPTLIFRDRIQKSEGRPIELTVMRKGNEEAITIVPRKSPQGSWLLGVQISPEIKRQRVGVGTAAIGSFVYTIDRSREILGGLWEIVRGRAKADVIGPVGMTEMIQKQVKAGWVSAFEFLALLNVYLGLFNLLPLPALDGSRLAFLAYELGTRRRPNPKVETAVHMAGTVVLLVIMVLVLFKDIKRVIG
jgi:regulator of sigma E protease